MDILEKINAILEDESKEKKISIVANPDDGWDWDIKVIRPDGTVKKDKFNGSRKQAEIFAKKLLKGKK